jgi:SAM-dependent methyltransferase
MPEPAGKRYDRAYFERWYRNPRTRVVTIERQRQLARDLLLQADWMLGRPLTSVIDIGCGEGAWGEALIWQRPGLAYAGYDSSEWAVSEYGTARHLHHCALADLRRLPLQQADLLLCHDVLHYVADTEIEAALAAIGRWSLTLAYVSVMSEEIDFVGDRVGYLARPAATYRRWMTRHGWVPAGGSWYRRRR